MNSPTIHIANTKNDNTALTLSHHDEPFITYINLQCVRIITYRNLHNDLTLNGIGLDYRWSNGIQHVYFLYTSTSSHCPIE